MRARRVGLVRTAAVLAHLGSAAIYVWRMIRADDDLTALDTLGASASLNPNHAPPI